MFKCARLLSLLMFAAPPALAAEQDITLTATVPGSCTISDSDAPSALSQNLSIDASGRVSTSTLSFSFPFVCNKAATLEVATANRGLSGPSPVAGYDNKIHYIATTSGVFPSVGYNTLFNAPDLPGGGSPYVSSSGGAAQGTLTVSVKPTANTNPLVAGTYSDTLRLIITPTQ